MSKFNVAQLDSKLHFLKIKLEFEVVKYTKDLQT